MLLFVPMPGSLNYHNLIITKFNIYKLTNTKIPFNRQNFKYCTNLETNYFIL